MRYESCQVCGKSVLDRDIYTALRFREKKVVICCPICLALFQRDPDQFLSSIPGFEVAGQEAKDDEEENGA